MITSLIAAEPITNPALDIYKEGEYKTVAANPLGPFIARLWWTIVIIGALALLIFLIWGGVDLLTSEGDQEKYKSARNKITHALMGMAILASSFAIIKLLNVVFGFDILKLDWPGPS